MLVCSSKARALVKDKHTPRSQKKSKVSLLKINNLNYPLIIKPAKLGSSIGISIAHSQDELLEKVQYSLKFDTKI